MPASTEPKASDIAGSDSGNGVSEQSPEITIRPATADDIIDFYGKPHEHSLRATAAIMDGSCVGIVGVVRHKEWGTYFSDFKPVLQPYLKSITIMRAIKDSLRYVRRYRGPVLSIADDAEGCRILHRLGFKHLHGAWWGWLG